MKRAVLPMMKVPLLAEFRIFGLGIVMLWRQVLNHFLSFSTFCFFPPARLQSAQPIRVMSFYECCWRVNVSLSQW